MMRLMVVEVVLLASRLKSRQKVEELSKVKKPQIEKHQKPEVAKATGLEERLSKHQSSVN